jgi:hypothetical protein
MQVMQNGDVRAQAAASEAASRSDPAVTAWRTVRDPLLGSKKCILKTRKKDKSPLAPEKNFV